MGAPLRSVHFIKYNDVQFGPYTRIVGVTVTPEPDPSGRATTCHHISIDLEAPVMLPAFVEQPAPDVFYSGEAENDKEFDPNGQVYDPRCVNLGAFVTNVLGENQLGEPNVRGLAPVLDPVSDELRRRLREPGKPFIFESTGFGAIRLNIAGDGPQSPADLKWGPKPKPQRWRLMGGNRAWMLSWGVDVWVPDCETEAQDIFKGRPLHLSYSLSVAQDAGGYSTLSHSGELAIPLTRSTGGGKVPLDDAFAYRELVWPTPPIGFKRTAANWQLSADRRVVTFTINDIELPERHPPIGCVEARFSHAVRNQNPRGFVMHSHVCTGEYEVAKGRNRRETLKYFLVDCLTRVLDVNNRGRPILPVNFSATEPNAYGRGQGSFSFSFVELAGTENDTSNPTSEDEGVKPKMKPNIGFFSTSGLWLTPPGSQQYHEWRQSLANSMFRYNGTAQLVFNRTPDELVGVCGAEATNGLDWVVPETSSIDLASIAAALGLTKPPKLASWLDYENSAKLIVNDSVVEQIPLDPSERQVGQEEAGDQFGQSDPEKPATYGPTGAEVVSTIVRRTKSSVFLVLEGRATRVGYPIQSPKVTEYGGVTCTPANRESDGFRTWISGHLVWPIHSASWRLRYLLPKSPSTVEPPPHPHYILDEPGEIDVSPGSSDTSSG